MFFHPHECLCFSSDFICVYSNGPSVLGLVVPVLQESEEEGRPSDMDYDFESSSDDDDAEMWTERKERKSVREPAPKFYEIKTGMDLETSGVQEARKPKLK